MSSSLQINLFGDFEGVAATGAELTFQLNYSALIRAMASPFVVKLVKDNTEPVRVSALKKPVLDQVERRVTHDR